MDKRDYLMLIGAPKCGTTSVASWLGNQPYAVLSNHKETLYFTDFADHRWSGPGTEIMDTIPSDPETFETQFRDKPEAALRIEASTDNLSCAAAAENIARFAERDDVGEVWVVALLRDPIERIVSEFEHTLRLGWQSGSLLDSLQAEEERISKGWHPLFRHIERSRYATQLARYRELFGNRLLTLDFHRIGEVSERSRLLNWIDRTDNTENKQLEHRNQRSVIARSGAVGLLKNESLMALGRSVVPKSMRPVVRRWVSGGFADRYEPNETEIRFIRSALMDEINACLEADNIPTEHWGTSAGSL